MILIADSGATKTDWRLIDKKGNIHQAKTHGLHPVYQGLEELRDEIQTSLKAQISDTGIEQIYFYGAGCATIESKELIRIALQYSFPEAKIEVNDDLIAAARSLCGYEKGIACILGTGSNSCLYDGEKIVENIAALGFILGDEGSGAHLGKTLLSDYLRNNLPEDLKIIMYNKFKLDKAEIIEKVYNQERPSRFLAGFSKFVFDHISHEYLHQLVRDGFLDFFRTNIFKYSDYQNMKVHFTGGVAFYFNKILREVAEENEVIVGNIVENPISGLSLYHIRS